MNSSSKIIQKVSLLTVLTLAVWFFNEYLPDPSIVVAKASARNAAAAEIGKPAPAFSLKDTKGKTWSLQDLKGKVIVLEWFNHGCPFVKKHYNSGNMQKLQKTYTSKGVTWLCICSSAKGKQGNQEPGQHLQTFKSKNSKPSAILIDENGEVGRKYGAKTTPQMYIVDKQGNLVYQGAIDDKRGTDADQVKTASNYVVKALDEVIAGKKVSEPETKPYGCSVKY